jgi:hypothetical protein
MTNADKPKQAPRTVPYVMDEEQAGLLARLSDSYASALPGIRERTPEVTVPVLLYAVLGHPGPSAGPGTPLLERSARRIRRAARRWPASTCQARDTCAGEPGGTDNRPGLCGRGEAPPTCLLTQDARTQISHPELVVVCDSFGRDHGSAHQDADTPGEASRHHCPILNRIQRPDGSWYAPDAVCLYQHVVAVTDFGSSR